MLLGERLYNSTAQQAHAVSYAKVFMWAAQLKNKKICQLVLYFR